MKRASAPIARVLCDQPQKLANKLRVSFARATGIPDASLKEVQQARNGVALVLRGQGGVAVGGDQIALPLVRGKDDDYWLAAKIVLEPFFSKYALKSISISIFRGMAQDEKRTILRAEWDCPIGVPNEHAQPHWHAFPILESDDPIDYPALNEFLEDPPAIFSLEDGLDLSARYDEDNPLKKIHLAMSAFWHLSEKPEDKIFLTSEEQVGFWIENCTRYLKRQIGSFA